MNIPLFNWFTRPDGLPELMHDLRSGKAGFKLRAALSVAAAGATIGLLLGLFGLFEAVKGRIEDEHVFIGLSLGGVAWCGSLAWLWSGFRGWQRTLRTVFGIVALWALMIPLTLAIDQVIPNAELLIASCVVLGLTITLAVIATVAYRSRGGRRLRDATGDIQVLCPKCGYSMTGLESCQCPECGHRCTIDALIASQDYDAHRLPRQHSGAEGQFTAHAAPTIEHDRSSLKALPHGSA